MTHWDTLATNLKDSKHVHGMQMIELRSTAWIMLCYQTSIGDIIYDSMKKM